MRLDVHADEVRQPSGRLRGGDAIAVAGHHDEGGHGHGDVRVQAELRRHDVDGSRVGQQPSEHIGALAAGDISGCTRRQQVQRCGRRSLREGLHGIVVESAGCRPPRSTRAVRSRHAH